jgi:hypothetical protein
VLIPSNCEVTEKRDDLLNVWKCVNLLRLGFGWRSESCVSCPLYFYAFWLCTVLILTCSVCFDWRCLCSLSQMALRMWSLSVKVPHRWTPQSIIFTMLLFVSDILGDPKWAPPMYALLVFFML